MFSLVAAIAVGSGEGQLLENFYQSTCPSVEAIVRQAVTAKLSQTSVTVPATLRLFFHDCFVEVQSISVLAFAICLLMLSRELYNYFLYLS